MSSAKMAELIVRRLLVDLKHRSGGTGAAATVRTALFNALSMRASRSASSSSRCAAARGGSMPGDDGPSSPRPVASSDRKRRIGGSPRSSTRSSSARGWATTGSSAQLRGWSCCRASTRATGWPSPPPTSISPRSSPNGCCATLTCSATPSRGSGRCGCGTAPRSRASQHRLRFVPRAGGDETWRLRWFRITIIFVGDTLRQTVSQLRRDRTLWKWRTWQRGGVPVRDPRAGAPDFRAVAGLPAPRLPSGRAAQRPVEPVAARQRVGLVGSRRLRSAQFQVIVTVSVSE